MFQKRKRYGEKNEGAHMWAVVRWSGKNAISPQRILLHPVTRPPVGTYGTLGRFGSLPSTPGYQLALPTWQLPIRRLPAIGSQLAEVMCTNH